MNVINSGRGETRIESKTNRKAAFGCFKPAYAKDEEEEETCQLACQLAKPLKRSLAKNSFPGKSACRFPLQLLNQVGYFYICQVNSFENTTNGQWLLGN
ncbi:hypothetical protein T02_5444 [Trichinella nativa]|uniref:Uncharacterized protein n=1 Tax=Trichinella nativa TaxID=6335 RepID=A0A0V1LLX9_9BILA|nr:hypothetical protein T02_5444 [Trichinella nativa]